jgi:ornithine cyclodeaminase
MHSDSVRVIRGEDVMAVLAGRAEEVIERVGIAYQLHARGQSSLPHSTFLRFPGRPADRIIALPAFLGEGVQAAGIKWIASVPGNLERGLERASAVMILNDAVTGHARAIMEASVISAARTAASAALAARVLGGPDAGRRVGLIGCGRISLDVVRYLAAVFPQMEAIELFDLDSRRAEGFATQLRAIFPRRRVNIQPRIEAVLTRCDLVSFATTAGEPHVHDLSMCPPGTTILHVSLRDLSVECILGADNVVDDADHVCRAATSLHLAEQRTGTRDFIRCGIGEILNGTAAPRTDPLGTTIFSPFGLGILDLAVAQMVAERAEEAQLGVRVDSFLPPPALGYDRAPAQASRNAALQSELVVR